MAGNMKPLEYREYFLLLSPQTVAHGVTSVPVPAVVGIAIYRSPFAVIFFDLDTKYSSMSPLCVVKIAAHFAVSNTEPPPIAMIASYRYFLQYVTILLMVLKSLLLIFSL